MVPLHHQLRYIGDFDKHAGTRGQVTNTNCEHILQVMDKRCNSRGKTSKGETPSREARGGWTLSCDMRVYIIIHHKIADSAIRNKYG